MKIIRIFGNIFIIIKIIKKHFKNCAILNWFLVLFFFNNFNIKILILKFKILIQFKEKIVSANTETILRCHNLLNLDDS